MATNFIPIDDWTALPGARAVIKIHGAPVCTGKVDAVTADGKILWVQPEVGGRKLYEKTAACVVWVDDANLGLHYRVTHPWQQRASGQPPETSGRRRSPLGAALP